MQELLILYSISNGQTCSVLYFAIHVQAFMSVTVTYIVNIMYTYNFLAFLLYVDHFDLVI